MKIVVTIAVLHVFLAVFLGATLSISSDESCSIATTGDDIAHALSQSIQFEWQPPGYFLTLWLWRQIHSSIVWARCLSVLCTTVSIFVFYSVARRVAREQMTWPYWATVVFALHPYTLFAATEMRLYAMALCLSVVQFDWFFRSYLTQLKFGRWIYFFVALSSLYVNSLLVLTLAAQNATLWLTSRWKEARQHLSVLMLVGLLFLPMFWLQLEHLKNKDTPAGEQSLAKAASFVLGSVVYHLGPLPRVDATLFVRTILTVAFIAIFGWLAVRNYRESTDLHKTVWTYWLAITCFLFVFVVIAKLLPNMRYTFPLLLSTLLAWGKATEFIRSQAVVSALWSVTLVLCIGSVIFTYQPWCKSGDWVRVSKFVESLEQENQPIIVFTNEVDTILRNYYRGPNMVIPIPSPQRMDRFLYSDFDIPSEHAIEELLDPLLKESQFCWLVTYNGGIRQSPHAYHREFLDSYLEEHFVEVAKTPFFETSVSRLQRRQ